MKKLDKVCHQLKGLSGFTQHETVNPVVFFYHGLNDALTTRLIQLGVWGLVFSPYLIGLAIAIVVGRKVLARRKNLIVAAPNLQSRETSEL